MTVSFTSVKVESNMLYSTIQAGTGRQMLGIWSHNARNLAFVISGPGFTVIHALRKAYDAASQRALNSLEWTPESPAILHDEVQRFDELLGMALRTTVLS